MARRLCAEPDRERRGSTAAHLGTSEVRREGQCNTKRNAMRVLGLLPETQRLALRASCLGLCREYAPERDGRARHLTAHCAVISQRTIQRTCAGVASVRSHAISRPTEECDSRLHNAHSCVRAVKIEIALTEDSTTDGDRLPHGAAGRDE